MNAIVALCHFCEQHGPSLLFCTQPFHCTNHTPDDVLRGVPASRASCGFRHSRLMRGKSFHSTPSYSVQEQNTPSSQSRQSTCEACRSLESGDPGLISIDRESHISYISSQYPEEQELYSILRHACVRSLSCEVCPGREAPIIFGEEATGYVFSHTFFLKDSQSRGFQRWYSIICVMMDRIYLVNSWPFLVSNFRTIIEELQAKTEAVYKAEQAAQPQRAMRLQSSGNSFLVTPDPFRRSRGGNHNYRSLTDITKEKNIFHFLHQRFSWILMASGQRFSEKLLEGPPPEDYLYEPNKDETEEGVQRHFEEFPADATGSVFRSLRHMAMVIGLEKLRLLAFHVVRGDQLIVRGKHARTVQSALQVLKELIPSGCCKCRLYSSTYQDSWKYNFLGVPDSVQLPPHILASDLYVLMDINCQDPEAEQEDDRNRKLMTDSETDNSFDHYRIRILGSEVRDSPTYLQKAMAALEDDGFSDSVFEAIISALKEEWINYGGFLGNFSASVASGGSGAMTKEKLIGKGKANSKVKILFTFTKSGSRTSEDKNRVLKILNSRPEDEILLKFWMTSLSRAYRSHLLSGMGQQTQASGEISSRVSLQVEDQAT